MRYSRLAFMNRFTDTELGRIFSAAKVSVAVEVWLAKFNAATPDADGTCIDTDNLETISGLIGLEQAGLLDAGRTASDILGQAAVIPSQSLDGISVGDLVRVLSPFDSAYPDTYEVISVSGESININGVDFAPSYLEKV